MSDLRDVEICRLQEEVGNLRAEIARLRAALRKIVAVADHDAFEPLDDCIAIARRALEEKA